MNRLSKILLFGLMFTMLLAHPIWPREDAREQRNRISSEIKNWLKDITQHAKRTPPNKETLGFDVRQVEELVHRMETNLKDNLPPCERAPAPPDMTAAIGAMKGLVDEKFNEKKEEITKIEKRLKEIEKKLCEKEKERDKLEIELTDLETAKRTTNQLIKKAKLAGAIAGGGIQIIVAVGSVGGGSIPRAIANLGMQIADMIRSGLSASGGKIKVNASASEYSKQLEKVHKAPGYKERMAYLAKHPAEYNKWFLEQAKKQKGWDPTHGKPLKITLPEIINISLGFISLNIDVDIKATKQKIKDVKAEITTQQKKVDQAKQELKTKKDLLKTKEFGDLLQRLEDALAKANKWSDFEDMKPWISVRVIDDETSNDIVNADVKISPAGGTQQTHSNPFEFAEVPLARYSIEGNAPDYIKETVQIDVTTCQVYQVDIRLKRPPVIRITGIVDDTGNPITDPINVSTKNLGSGASPAPQTYNNAPIEFTVDPGAYEIDARDPNGLYELVRKKNVNADAGKTIDVQLEMRQNEFNFVIEVYDQRSGLKIDPPVGSSAEPHVSLEPLDGQPAPSGGTYQGNGELHYKFVRTGRYRYKANFHGWEFKEGVFDISATEAATGQVVRKVHVKPYALEEHTGDVFENWNNHIIPGFKVTLTGMGPRTGDNFSAVEGNVPGRPGDHIGWSTFIIEGPIYSGKYRLEIIRECYQPYIREDWWTFSPLTAPASAKQTYYMEPTPALVAARKAAKEKTDLLEKQLKKLKTAVKDLQTSNGKIKLIEKSISDLLNKINALAQNYTALAQQCTQAGAKLPGIKKIKTEIDGIANEIITLRETAKNLAGVTCQLAEKAKNATNPTTASNQAVSAGKFAKQTEEKAAEARQKAQVARNRFANMQAQFPDVESLSAKVENLKRERRDISEKVKKIDNSLSDIGDGSATLAEVRKAITEADKLIASITAALQPCISLPHIKTMQQKADNVRNSIKIEEGDLNLEKRNLQASLQLIKINKQRINNKISDLQKIENTCNVLEDFADAKPTIETIDVFVAAAEEAAQKAKDCASQAIANQQLVPKIKTNIAKCEFESALKLAQQLQQVDPGNTWLAGNLSDLQNKAQAQKEARTHLKPAEAAIQKKDLDGAIASLKKAGAVPNLPTCMSKKITALHKELERRRKFVKLTEQVERASFDCKYDEAARLIGEIKAFSPPHEPFITDWLNTSEPKLADLKEREKKTLNFINNAQNLANQADALSRVDPPDWQAITPVLKQAAKALADAENTAPFCVRDREKPKIDRIRKLILDIQSRKKVIETSIALLIDTSGSMKDSGKMDKAKRAARASVSNVSKTTEMAVLRFSGGCGEGAMRVAAPFSTNATTLAGAINTLSPGGGTPMYIATAAAVEYVQKNGRGKKRMIVLLSDGADTCKDKKVKAANAVRTSNIPVNTIGFDVDNNAEAQRELQDLANMSRGRNYSAGATDPREIRRVMIEAVMQGLLKPPDVATGSGSNAIVADYFSKARTMVEQQNIAGALFQFQQAHKVAPNSPAVNFNLSLAYEAEDQLIAAKNHAEQYLNLAPDALDRSEVETRIANLEEELQRNPRFKGDPSGCRDLYLWARKERKAAKRSKNAGRRQAVLEIMITSQKGDCEQARSLAAQYKQRYATK